MDEESLLIIFLICVDRVIWYFTHNSYIRKVKFKTFKSVFLYKQTKNYNINHGINGALQLVFFKVIVHVSEHSTTASSNLSDQTQEHYQCYLKSQRIQHIITDLENWLLSLMFQNNKTPGDDNNNYDIDLYI